MLICSLSQATACVWPRAWAEKDCPPIDDPDATGAGSLCPTEDPP